MAGSQILTAALTTTDGASHTLLTIPLGNGYNVTHIVYKIIAAGSSDGYSTGFNYGYCGAFVRYITVFNSAGTLTILTNSYGNAGPHAIEDTDDEYAYIQIDDHIADFEYNLSAAPSGSDLLIQVGGHNGYIIKWYITADIIQMDVPA